MRAEKFDCCINLHGGTTSAWLTWLSGARHRVGLKSFRNSFCYNVRIVLQARNLQKTKQHTVEYQMEWLRALGMPSGEIPPLRVFPDPEVESRVKDTLCSMGSIRTLAIVSSSLLQNFIRRSGLRMVLRRSPITSRLKVDIEWSLLGVPLRATNSNVLPRIAEHGPWFWIRCRFKSSSG